MALLTGYRHDIFVSYAHNDNQPLMSGEEGWVRTLVNLLRVRTVEKIGSNALDIWMDYSLSGNSPVTPTITDALTGSAILRLKSTSRSPIKHTDALRDFARALKYWPRKDAAKEAEESRS